MVIALLASGLYQGLLADCDGCPKRLVRLYDVDVQSTAPTDPVELVQWWSLFFAAGGMNGAVMSDASLSCVAFLDGSVVDPSGEITDTLALGLGISSRPPAGSIGGADYVLSGTVAGAPGAYTLSLTLETSCSREQVAGGSVSFATGAEALEAGRTLAGQTLFPIATTIRQFEENKRFSDVAIARNVADQAIEIIPSKKRVTRGESVPVTVKLTDCDNILLAGRTLTLTETVFHGVGERKWRLSYNIGDNQCRGTSNRELYRGREKGSCCAAGLFHLYITHGMRHGGRRYCHHYCGRPHIANLCNFGTVHGNLYRAKSGIL